MNRIWLMFLMLFPSFAFSQTDSLQTGVYAWKEPAIKNKYGLSTVLFEGQTNSMEWLQMTANTILFSKKKESYSFKVPGTEEQIMVIKSGTVLLSVGDSSYTIGAGSVALLLPGENFSFRSDGLTPCIYYTIKYKSKLAVDITRGRTAGGSLVKEWNQTEFKPGDKGGRRNFFERATAMCKRLEIHVTTLKEGLKSHAPHTHQSAEFTLIKEGKTEMLIGDKFYSGSTWDVYYAGSNVLHALENKGTTNCTYFAIQFE